jgi:hypothetical protein
MSDRWCVQECLLLPLEHGEHAGLHEAEEARLVRKEAAQK